MTRIQVLEKQNRDFRTRLENQRVKAELTTAAYQEKILALKEQLGTLPAQVVMLQESLAKCEEAIAGQKAEIVSLRKEKTKLENTVEKLKLAIVKLRARLRKDSTTSDVPPSNNVYKKPRTRSMREKSGRKPGGQFGHAGHTLPLFPDPDHIEKKVPESCGSCGSHNLVLTGEYTAKQKVDIEVNINTTEEQSLEAVCIDCGKTTCGEFSEGFSSPVHYGENLKAIVALLTEHGFVSIAKTAEIISSLTGGAINLSWGTIVNMQKELSLKLEETISIILAALIAGKVMGADETGCRVNGKLNWIQVFCNEGFTLFGLNEKRGDIDENYGLLAYFVGILVHDHFMSYYKYETLTHAECNQHILRLLKGLIEIFRHSWLLEMMNLLKSACHEKNELVRSGATEMPPEQIDEFSARYDALLKKGWHEYNADTAGDKNKESYHTEERRLLTRLGEYKEEHLLFLKDFNAPFTNNVSEQDIRKFKSKQKASGCFRSEEGARVYARIASLITTLKKQSRNVFEGIRAVYTGGVPISSA